MTAVLRKLPFLERPSAVSVRGESVAVKGHQIIVWVSIGSPTLHQLEASCPRFPAILDTASNFTFSIRESQVRNWAGMAPQSLDSLGHIRHQGTRLPVYSAHIWLHRNRPGARDIMADEPPFRLELESGIAVYPRGLPQAPRLPLLGLRALEENRLHLQVDAEHRWVSLRTRDWRTWLARWLF